MSDEQIRELAKEIILDVVNRTQFPPNVTIKVLDEFVEFKIEIGGQATVSYKPQLSAEQIIKDLEEQFLRWEVSNKLDAGEYSSIYKSLVNDEASYAIEILLNQFSIEFEDTLQILPELAMIQSECIGNEMYERLFIIEDQQRPEPSEKKIDNCLKSINKKRRGRMMKPIISIREESKFDSINFAASYEKLLSIWQDAKRLYRQNKNLPTWRAIIKTAYQQHDLPDDLIERLNSLDSYEATPSEIALEHAARICKINVKPRTLWNYLKQGRKSQ